LASRRSALNVRLAVPAPPETIVTVATRSPAFTTTGPSTLATAGFDDVAVTGVSTAAGASRIRTRIVCRPLIAVNS
jgi:hypothetical protein